MNEHASTANTTAASLPTPAECKRPERAADPGAAQRTVTDGERGQQVTLRYERTLPHPVARVWQGVITPEGQKSWYPMAIHGDLLTEGAELRYTADMPDGEEMVVPGRVLEADPERRWSIGGESPVGEQRVNIELTPLSDSSTGLSFEHQFAADPAMEPALAAGWHLYMEQFAAHLAGVDEVYNDGNHEDLTAAYAERFAAQ